MAVEIMLDSMAQRYPDDKIYENRGYAFYLGKVRSALGKIGHVQETLKRHCDPAPNQETRNRK
jgi:hypothetical protein